MAPIVERSTRGHAPATEQLVHYSNTCIHTCACMMEGEKEILRVSLRLIIVKLGTRQNGQSVKCIASTPSYNVTCTVHPDVVNFCGVQ